MDSVDHGIGERVCGSMDGAVITQLPCEWTVVDDGERLERGSRGGAIKTKDPVHLAWGTMDNDNGEGVSGRIVGA